VHDEVADSKYLGALSTKEFAAGEPLLTSSLIKPGDRGFLAALLAPGTRAVSIAVEATQSASGLLLPDNRVDIILTQTFENDADPARKSVGETILKNLRVIAVDRRLGPALAVAEKSLSLEASIPKIITLEATEREAETLMVASRLGRLEVAVRALGRADTEHPGREDAVVSLWAADVSPALKTIRRAAATAMPTGAPAAPAQSARKSIEVMHGSKIEAR
jgi:pilus assembly protein CpaB